jgi:hypothetical protein
MAAAAGLRRRPFCRCARPALTYNNSRVPKHENHSRHRTRYHRSNWLQHHFRYRKRCAEGRPGSGRRRQKITPQYGGPRRSRRRTQPAEYHGKIHRSRRTGGAARPRQCRYRRHHSEAVPEVDPPYRLRSQPVRRVALPGPRRTRHGQQQASAEPGLRAEPAALPGRVRSCWPARISAAAPRASMRRGRSSSTASAPSSRRALPISSSTTATRTACCPIVLTEAQIDHLFNEVKAFPGYRLVVDLEATSALPRAMAASPIPSRSTPSASTA